MPVTKKVYAKRTIVEYTLDEFKTALGLTDVLAVYLLNGNVQVVTQSGD